MRASQENKDPSQSVLMELNRGASLRRLRPSHPCADSARGSWGPCALACWQALRRRQKKFARDSKLFRDYARQALTDTLVLYLHGICCDIDVEAGPRMLPSRHLRKRLDVFYELFPPPQGYAIFPEQVSTA